MAVGLLGLKVGMTSIADEKGNMNPVTVLQLGPCPVLQVRTPERDGYHAVQLGFMDKARRKATRAERGHVAADFVSNRRKRRQAAGVQLPPKADVEPQRYVREFRLTDAATFAVGDLLDVGKVFDKVTKKVRTKDGKEAQVEGYPHVDVIGTSKGRGTTGVMKRHNFAGLPASHGAKKVHRQSGSTGSLASNRGSGRPKKGLRRPGRHGNARVTIRNLEVIRIDPDNHVMLVKGAVPGFNGSFVMVRPTNRKG